MWHFCGKVNNEKIEKINERALRILFNDYTSSYKELLDLSTSDSILLARLKNRTLDVFQFIKKLNPLYLNELIEIKAIPYETLKSIQLVQPLCQTTTYGLRTISYTGAKLWNNISKLDVKGFRSILKSRKGVDFEDLCNHYV